MAASSGTGGNVPAQGHFGTNDAAPALPPPVWSDADLQTLMEVTGLEQEGARELLWAHGSAVSAINAHFSAADAPLAPLAHEEESEDTDDDEDNMHVRCLICEKDFVSQLYLDKHRHRSHPTLEQLQRGVSFLSDQDELLSFGINTRTSNTRTSDENDLRCAALLLENGSQVDVPFEQGGDRASDETQHQWEWDFNRPPTPLALACVLLDENMVMLLLHHGADPHRPYPYGFTMDDELDPGEEDVANRIGHHIEAARACWQGRGKAACSCPWHNWGRLPTSTDGTDAAPVTNRHVLTAIHPTQLPSVTPPAAAAAAPAPMPPSPQPSAKALGKRKM